MPNGEIGRWVKYALSLPREQWFDYLEGLLTGGVITESQYISIANELKFQSTAAEEARKQVEMLPTIAPYARGKVPDPTKAIEEAKRAELILKEQQRQQESLERPVPERLMPEYREPEYGAMFEEAVEGLEGPLPWKDWFESKFSSLLREFRPLDVGREYETWAERIEKQWRSAQAHSRKITELERGFQTVPADLYERETGREATSAFMQLPYPSLPPIPTGGAVQSLPGMLAQREQATEVERERQLGALRKQGTAYRKRREYVSPAEQAEKSWAEYLQTQISKLREEYATRYPYGQYGRPWAYAPGIRTVQF